MTYHPNTSPNELPEISCVEDLDGLPWGGNAWWDVPIMFHVDKFIGDETKPRDVRKAVAERAGFLMTGEDCTRTEDEFDDYVQMIKA